MSGIQVRKSKDGKKRFRVRIRHRGQQPVSKTFERLTDAKRWAQQMEVKIRERRYFGIREAQRRTVNEVIDRYEREMLPHLNPKDRGTRPSHLNWWRKKLGHLFLADVTPSLIRDAREGLREGKGPSGRPIDPATCNRYTGTLSSVFGFAQRDLEWIEENPVRKVRRLRESQGRVRYLEDDERDRLLQVCKDSPERYLYPAVVISITTGMRQAELMTLRWRQVNFKRGVAVLEKTKNRERRTVPIKGYALEVLRELSRIRRIDTDLVFPRQDGKKAKIIRGHWEAALSEAGIEDFRWHDLRHCAGSYAAMMGWSELEIADLLGHKTTRMVRRYSHLSESHLEKRSEEMAERIFGATQTGSAS